MALKETIERRPAPMPCAAIGTRKGTAAILVCHLVSALGRPTCHGAGRLGYAEQCKGQRPTETRFSRSRSVEPALPSIRRRKRTKDEGHGVARPKKIIKHALEFGELGLVAQNPMQVTEGGRKRE
jgi:hypothetical protein